MRRLTRAGFGLTCATWWLCVPAVVESQTEELQEAPSSAQEQDAPSTGWIEVEAPPPPEAPKKPDFQTGEPPASPQPMPSAPAPAPSLKEQAAPANPDWVVETRPPKMEAPKRRATEDYALRYAARRLALPRGMIRGTFDLVAGKRAPEQAGFEPFGPTGTVSSLNLGVALGISDTFEIGLSRYRVGSTPDMSIFPQVGFGGEGLISFMLAPDFEFGDIPLYLRFQALDADHVQIAFDAVFRIPSNTRFGFLGAVPLRINTANDNLAIDTGLEFSADDNPKGRTIWSLSLPLNIVGNVSPSVFLKLNSGMHFFDLGDVVGTATSGLVGGPFYFIPLGFGGGYSVEARRSLLDLFASFRWPTLFGFNSDGSELSADTWAITIGVNVYSPRLF